ncbi:DUF2274 domain-containing protein [Xanthomonas hyacinthi]|nr:DUF2274 domain-containing protein [Xanthomonas hyacinthi]
MTAPGWLLDFHRTYGEAVDATTLIRHTLEAFMAGERGFERDKTAGTKTLDSS